MNNTNRFKLIILFAVLVITVVLVAYFFLQRDINREAIVYIDEDGFSTAGLIVEVGDRVKFENKTDTSVWPASDIHPTHELYPEFDARGPIAPGGIWEFTFDQIGTWRYHDHLNPNVKGTIQVVAKNSFIANATPESDALSTCTAISEGGEAINCWMDYLESVVIEDGVEKSLEVVQRLRETDPSFAAYCHTIVHNIGEVAYWLYADGEKLPKSGIISTCGYAFHHGFMQEFGHHDENFVEKVPALCDYFVNKVNYDRYEKSVDPLDQCYHGVGHGLAFYYISQYWDNEIEIIKQGAADCRKLSNDEEIVSNCTYGLFGGMSGFYTGGHGYKKELDMSDPFQLCEGQKEDNLKDACYDSMLPVIWVYANFDANKTLSYFSKVREKEFLVQAMYNFGDILSPRFWTGEISKEKVLTICQSLEQNLYVQCIKGFAEGIIGNGLPQSAVEEAIGFCELVLDKDMKDMCLKSVEERAKLDYSSG